MIDVIVLAAVALAGIGGVITFAIRGSTSDRAAADARVAKAETDGKLAIATATIATERNRADDEKRKADALDDALAATWSDPDPDPGTARERVLARWTINRASLPGRAAGAAASPVHPAPDAAAGSEARLDGDGLIKPGE
jgi:hypothetical protein